MRSEGDSSGARGQGAGRVAAARGTGGVVGTARPAVLWLLLIALGTAPAIILDAATGRVPDSLTTAQLIVGLAAVVLCAAFPALRPLLRPAVVLAALVGLPALVASGDHTAESLQALLGGGAFVSAMQPGQTAKLVVAAAMILLLLVMGLRPRDFFLRRGDLAARIRPAPLLGFPRPDPWPRFGLVWGLGIAAGLGVVQYLVTRPTAEDLGALLPVIPAVLVFAALNAFTEEMTYRAPLIATAEPVVGGGQALWLSAVYFGVAHYFGVPGGLIGAALSVFMGWILGKAMQETGACSGPGSSTSAAMW